MELHRHRLAVEQKPDFGPARYELGIALGCGHQSNSYRNETSDDS